MQCRPLVAEEASREWRAFQPKSKRRWEHTAFEVGSGNLHSQASPGVRRAGPTRASPAFNFSQLSVRLLSVPFPFMYSKFPLPAGRTEKRSHPSPARPPQLERGRVEASLMAAHLPLCSPRIHGGRGKLSGQEVLLLWLNLSEKSSIHISRFPISFYANSLGSRSKHK